MDRRQFLIGGGLVTLSACASHQGLYRPRSLNLDELSTALTGRRLLVGGHLDQTARKMSLEGKNQGYYPALPSQLRLYDIDSKSLFSINTDHYAHVYFQNPMQPMQIAGCMKWGLRAGVWQLDQLKESYSFDAPKGHHFYGHGVYTSDGKKIVFSSARDSDGRGTLLVYESATGKLLNTIDSRGRLPHELVWIEKDKKLLISQSPDTPTKSGRGGRITHLNFESGQADLQFDSELTSTHVLRIEPDLVSSGSTNDSETEATWFLMRESDRSMVRDFRSTLPKDESFVGEALSQRFFKSVIIMTTALGSRLLAWDPKSFKQTHLDFESAVRGVEVVDQKILVNLGLRGDLYQVDFDTEKFAFTTSEQIASRVSNSSHLQLIQT